MCRRIRITYSFILRSRVLENIRGCQLAMKFPAFYGTRKFITAFTRARPLSLFWSLGMHSELEEQEANNIKIYVIAPEDGIMWVKKYKIYFPQKQIKNYKTIHRNNETRLNLSCCSYQSLWITTSYVKRRCIANHSYVSEQSLERYQTFKETNAWEILV